MASQRPKKATSYTETAPPCVPDVPRVPGAADVTAAEGRRSCTLDRLEGNAVARLPAGTARLRGARSPSPLQFRVCWGGAGRSSRRPSRPAEFLLPWATADFFSGVLRAIGRAPSTGRPVFRAHDTRKEAPVPCVNGPPSFYTFLSYCLAGFEESLGPPAHRMSSRPSSTWQLGGDGASVTVDAGDGPPFQPRGIIEGLNLGCRWAGLAGLQEMRLWLEGAGRTLPMSRVRQLAGPRSAMLPTCPGLWQAQSFMSPCLDHACFFAFNQGNTGVTHKQALRPCHVAVQSRGAPGHAASGSVPHSRGAPG